MRLLERFDHHTAVEHAEPEHGEHRGDGDEAVAMPREIRAEHGGLEGMADGMDDDGGEYRFGGERDPGQERGGEGEQDEQGDGAGEPALGARRL